MSGENGGYSGKLKTRRYDSNVFKFSIVSRLGDDAPAYVMVGSSFRTPSLSLSPEDSVGERVIYEILPIVGLRGLIDILN